MLEMRLTFNPTFFLNGSRIRFYVFDNVFCYTESTKSENISKCVPCHKNTFQCKKKIVSTNNYLLKCFKRFSHKYLFALRLLFLRFCQVLVESKAVFFSVTFSLGKKFVRARNCPHC